MHSPKKEVKFVVFLAIATLLVAAVACSPTETAIAASPQSDRGTATNRMQRDAPPGPQILDFGRGGRIPVDALSQEARTPIPFNSGPQVVADLASHGKVVIRKSTVVVGEPDFQKRSVFFLYLDTLELLDHAGIVTGGNDLVIICNKLKAEDATITAFTEKTKKAADASATGGAGVPGVSGGTVTIIAINGIEGRLHVDLSGEDGGNGANGQLGANGLPGAKGENPEWGLFGCSHGGGDGLPGTPGQRGATGGPAGNGGSGGAFFLYNAGRDPIPTAAFEFVANSGNPGTSGPGGEGGIGGHGGDGGNGGGPCSGGHPGPNGANGANGETGQPGRQGSAGTSLVQNLDLELLVKNVRELPIGVVK
jgi:hypothetical protein